MFTRNFKNIYNAINSAGVNHYGESIAIPIKYYNATEYVMENLSLSEHNVMKNLMGSWGILSAIDVANVTCEGASALLIGKNDAEETEDDYTLDFVPSADLIHLEVTTVTSVSNNKATNTIIRTFIYTGSETITIREVGLFQSINIATGTSTPLLIMRKVLENPITVSNGETFTVTLEIDI